MPTDVDVDAGCLYENSDCILRLAATKWPQKMVVRAIAINCAMHTHTNRTGDEAGAKVSTGASDPTEPMPMPMRVASRSSSRRRRRNRKGCDTTSEQIGIESDLQLN